MALGGQGYMKKRLTHVSEGMRWVVSWVPGKYMLMVLGGYFEAHGT